jgi:hypothetical protein
MRFRLLTAYGDPDHVPEPADVLAWLHWCRQWDRSLRSGTGTQSWRSGTQPSWRSGTQPLRYPRRP